MITKIEIPINEGIENAVLLLQSHRVNFVSKLPAIFKKLGTGRWQDVNKERWFKFIVEIDNTFSPYWGLCKLQKRNNNSCTLLMWILPPKFILVMLGAFAIFVLYFFVKIGIHNYGTRGFWASVIIPPLLISFLYLLWYLMARINARYVKRNILRSLEQDRETENNLDTPS